MEVNSQVEVSGHQPILKGGVHRHLEGQARPYLQETKPVELKKLSGLTRPSSKIIRKGNNVWLHWDDSEKNLSFFPSVKR